MIIRSVRARQILDSRGNPTVEVDIHIDAGMVRAAVPSGASTGVHEALELRDGHKAFHGQSVLKAVRHINDIIGPQLVGKLCTHQRDIDAFLCQLDGTDNKRHLGANAILGVSIAVCKAGALATHKHWYEYVHQLYDRRMSLPVPFMNVINGGKHAGNSLPFQEFMIAPTGASSFSEGLQMGAEVYQELKKIISKHYGIDAINVGDEGGFAPPTKTPTEPLDLLMEAIECAGYSGRIKLAMDAAASELFIDGIYDLDFKKPSSATHKRVDAAALSQMYHKLALKYPIISIEDPFDQDDFSAHAQLLEKVQASTQIVGDDLLVTNTKRIQTAIDKQAVNALLLKINQIGTISESLDAASLAHGAGWNIMVSHRSGETEDPFIADLAVGIGAGQIKSGAPCRSERTAKYNQLLRIEEHGKLRYGFH